MNPPVLTTTTVPLASLKPYPGNPWQGDLETIRESLREHGQFRALVVTEKGRKGLPANTVLAGNHLLLAMQDEGWAEALVHRIDVNATQAARIVAADNRTSELGGYDEALLADMLRGLSTYEGTGYGDAEVADLFASLRDETPSPALDTTPAPATDAQMAGGLREVILLMDADDSAEFVRIITTIREVQEGEERLSTSLIVLMALRAAGENS